VVTWWHSSSKKILDCPFCWKLDGFTLMGHKGPPVNWMASPAAINSEVYCNSLTCLHHRIQLWCQGNWHPMFCSPWQCKTAQYKHWHPLDIPPYHIHHILHIWPHKTTLCSMKWRNHPGRKFPTCDDLERGVHNSVHIIPKDWYATAIQQLPERWQQCLNFGG
jgi:hypothetical protein